jgi:hypothetical protein
MDIIAIDPGRTTGIAIKIAEGYYTCTFIDPDDVYKIILSHAWGVVIYERFVASGMVSDHGIYTIELVGGIKALCAVNKLVGYPHVAIQRKPFIEAAKTKATSLVSHEVDAMAHLLAWEARNG